MNHRFLLIFFCLVFSLFSLELYAQDTQEKEKKLKLYGDFRFRAEQDWDSRRSDGTYRNDRFRLRYRTRFGFHFKWSDYISFGARLRSGSLQDQQSPHITLGDEFQPDNLGIDKAFLSGTYRKMWWWIGKNSFPFWKQNEMWWDDDVNPEGIALGWKLPSANLTVKPTIGYFIIREASEDESYLLAAQLAADAKLEKLNLSLGAGLFSFKNMPNIPEEGTYLLDYQLLNAGLKIELKTDTPISFGFDYMLNLEDYDTNADVPENFRDQTSGFVANASYGRLSAKGDFQIAYYYAKVAKLSVVDYLSQDDWVRWSFSDAAGTRSSNLKGHEIRMAYAFGSSFNTVLRVYFVEGVVPRDNMSDNESGNRARIDFNIKF